MLIFLDLETTGITAEDRVCSIALVDEKSFVYEFINEGKKIPPTASAIHHITNEMIQRAPELVKSQSWGYLQEHNLNENIIIGHNVSFDIEMLEKKGFVWQGELIDTMRVAKHLIEECDSYALQNLRYELKLYKKESNILQNYGIKDAIEAHNALGDALVVKLLFEYLSEFSNVDEMLELTHKKVLLNKFSFGKYKERYIEEIVLNDRAYIEWMYGLQDIDEDLRYSLEYYLEG
ncbi:MAG: 3'-5' exonuclease [Campylobacterales bacterium]|nr:3'-5' exonuclease [Campylobacterales bacterium]